MLDGGDRCSDVGAANAAGFAAGVFDWGEECGGEYVRVEDLGEVERSLRDSPFPPCFEAKS